MKWFIGTSGYRYNEWKGTFYPGNLQHKEMLGYYAGRLGAVEINSSFHKLPDAGTVATWMSQVPADFRFALKAPQRITHVRRLQNADQETAELLRLAQDMNRRSGPLLFQLPPNFKKDLPRLDAFLGLIGKAKAAFEFRHASWFDDDVFECLRRHACALAAADAEELPSANLVHTTVWGYLRLRREHYTDAALRKWVLRIRAMSWNEVFVFFKHEDTGTGPKLAKRLQTLIEKS